MGRIVGNAVFLSPGRSVSVATVEGAAETASRRGTDAAIASVSAETGRAWNPIAVPAEERSYRLAAADALLVYAQPRLSTADGTRIGREWAGALAGFLAVGGTVIVLVGGEGPEGGTLRILEGAGLISGTATNRVDISGALVHVTRPWDALATGVPLTYRAERSTVRIDLGTENAVVEDDRGPVVLHQTIVPD